MPKSAMPAITAAAPGKIILFGEHAVVYGRPAIAVPVEQVSARAVVSADPRGTPGQVRILAPDIRLDAWLGDLPPRHPLAVTVSSLLAELQIRRPPACRIRITSTIPVAAGMGSGAAVSVAVLRALSAFWGYPLPEERISALAYEVEKVYHGTPSGIDNTVVTYARPVFFVRDQPLEVLPVPVPFTLVTGDTGRASLTAAAVGDVRRAWQENRERYETLFDQVGEMVLSARAAIAEGQIHALGPLMDANQECLVEMGVSSPELDRLIAAAREAGAPGAKLSGGGRGGNMIALAGEADAPRIARALEDSGAVRVFTTTVGAADRPQG